MKLYESKIGKKYQTVVPLHVRETAHIEDGDSLLWEVRQDGTILVKPQKSKTDFLMSMNQKVWKTAEQAEQYLAQDRREWE